MKGALLFAGARRSCGSGETMRLVVQLAEGIDKAKHTQRMIKLA
jgi:hypothetical protein